MARTYIKRNTVLLSFSSSQSLYKAVNQMLRSGRIARYLFIGNVTDITEEVAITCVKAVYLPLDTYYSTEQNIPRVSAQKQPFLILPTARDLLINAATPENPYIVIYKERQL